LLPDELRTILDVIRTTPSAARNYVGLLHLPAH
jgi:hypothetical protein